MAGYFVTGALAAVGVLAILWALLGWLLPDGRGCLLVCYGAPDEGICSRYRWLRGAGLLGCPLVAVDAPEDKVREDVELCAGEDLVLRLKWERNQDYGTGTGDFTGRHQCRDLPEL